MMVLDSVIHPDAAAALLRCLRSGGDSLIALLGRVRRKEIVVSQYGTDRLASDYAHAHDLSRPEGRHLRSPIPLLHELLASFPRGRLLAAGCGPAVLVGTLLESPRHDYEITVIDQS